MHFLFFVVPVVFLVLEFGLHVESTCSLIPIDKKLKTSKFGGRYYLGDADPLSQAEAEECCISKRLTLATISGDEDVMPISRLFALCPHENDLREDAKGKSVWLSSNITMSKDMRKTGDGPCNSLAIQTYLGDFTELVIEGIACDERKQFICEKRAATNDYLMAPATDKNGIDSMSSTKAKWADARKYCDEKGQSLLNLLSERQKVDVLQLLGKSEEGKDGVWTGAFKDPDHGLRWSNDIPVDVPVENNEYGKNCVKLVTKSVEEKTFSYVAESCVNELPFVCSERITARAMGKEKTFEEKVQEFAGPELNSAQKAACLAIQPSLIETTKTLYCMRQNFTWRQSISCCQMKGMVLASFRSTDEMLPMFSCSNVFHSQRQDSKYRGPWTSANNFQLEEYHWFDKSDPGSIVDEHIWVDVWYNDNDLGSCVHFHGTNITNKTFENHNTKNPLCHEGKCWGLITANCLRETTFVCQKTTEPVTTTPSGWPTTTTMGWPTTTTMGWPTTTTMGWPTTTTMGWPTPAPVPVTTPTTGWPTTTTMPTGWTTSTTGGTTPSAGTTPPGPEVTTPTGWASSSTRGWTKPSGTKPTNPLPPCPPRPTSRPCDCKEGYILGNMDIVVESKFGIAYAIGKKKETFFQSIQECRKLNMTLLAIEFPAENNLVAKHRKPLDADLWTSGVTTSSGRMIQWMSTGRYLFFHPNGFKPDVSKDKCLAISKDGVWVVSDCGTKNYYMCEFRKR